MDEIDVSHNFKIGDMIRVFVRVPFKEHIASPMTIIEFHYSNEQLKYVKAENGGRIFELEIEKFSIKKN